MSVRLLGMDTMESREPKQLSMIAKQLRHYRIEAKLGAGATRVASFKSPARQ
jgi:hypothetical protein